MEVAHHVQRGVRREVPPLVELPHLLRVPLRHLVQLADREAAPQVVVPVQVLQQLAVHAVLDGVHHLRLRQHGFLLLCHAGVQELRVERHVVQDVQHVGDHVSAILIVRGRVHVEHRVVEIRVRVPARARTEPRVALLGPKKRDVLDEVRQALLVLALVHGPDVHLQVRLEAVARNLVREHHVPQAVRQPPAVDVLVRRELFVEKRRHRGGLHHVRERAHHRAPAPVRGARAGLLRARARGWIRLGRRREHRGLRRAPRAARDHATPAKGRDDGGVSRGADARAGHDGSGNGDGLRHRAGRRAGRARLGGSGPSDARSRDRRCERGESRHRRRALEPVFRAL